LDLLFYYQYGAVEFNVNILQMPFWAWGWFFGLDALQNKRYASWLGLGACIGLGALTKYIAVFMLVPLFAAWWQRGELKAALKSPGLYLAGAFSILLFLPHLVWMMNHEWITITYGLSRGGDEPAAWWQHLWHPVEFILGQAAIMAPALIIALICRKSSKIIDKPIPGTGALFFGTFVFIALFSLITGMAPVTMWAAPMPLAIGVWLVSRYRIVDHSRILYRMVGLAVVFYSVAYIVVFGLAPVIREKPHRVNYPGPELARQVEQIWQEQGNGRFDYIVADEWYGGIVNHYGEQRPAVVIHGDFKLATYLTEDDVKARGALVLWLKNRDHLSSKAKLMEREFPDIHSHFEEIIPLPDLIVPWPRRTDGKAGRYGIAYIPPAENMRDER
ncbi:MAG: glycosyltransferase family 39 protein, partial [Pontiella sp.]|nr:glycosyltransferase family 39 protein [Pontiella sp.]